MGVGIKVRELRKKKGMTQAELSKKSGVAQQTVSNIESGRNEPSGTTIGMLASALGCTADELIGNTQSHADGLTDEEKELLHIFRQLNADGRQLMLEQAESILSRPALRQEKRTASMG